MAVLPGERSAASARTRGAAGSSRSLGLEAQFYMVFPLVICIFPAIWIVTIGPAAIKFVQVLMPMAEK